MLSKTAIAGLLLVTSATFSCNLIAQGKPPREGFDCGKCEVLGERKSGFKFIVNAGGKCLDVHAPDMRNDGGKVQVWNCNGEPQQQWRLAGKAIVNAGGKCLDAHAPDMRNDGGKVQVWNCNGEPQQQWRLVGMRIVNAGGKCLDVHAPDMRNDGGRVQVWNCNGEPQQQWRLK